VRGASICFNFHEKKEFVRIPDFTGGKKNILKYTFTGQRRPFMKNIRALCLFLSILVFWFTAGCAKGSGGNETCGDGVCQISESETTCPQDCAQAGCGNGRIDDGEECDGSDLGGATCASIGYVTGSLGCTTSCRYNTSFCRSSCSDVCSDGQTRCNGNILET